MKLLLALVLLVFGCALAPDAAATSRRGVIALSVAGRGAGPLVLAPAADGSLEGELSIANVGEQALVVSRIAPRGTEDDVRSPPGLTARLVDGGGTTVTVPPHDTRRVRVRWAPPPSARQRQLFGHVVVTSTDDDAGEAAMGVRASRPGPFGSPIDHAPTLALGLPLLGAVLSLLARRWGTWIALGATAAQLLVAGLALAQFDAGIVRADGNDGLQMIDHVVWIRSVGIEYFVGLDGTNTALLATQALVAFAGSSLLAAGPPRNTLQPALYLLIVSAAAALTVALDGVLLLVAWSVLVVALYGSIRRFGDSPRRERTAARVLVMGLLAGALLLAALLLLHGRSSRVFLVDGSPAAHSFALNELMRVPFEQPTVAGPVTVKLACVLMVLATGCLLPLFPLHGWLVDAAAEAPAPAAVLLVSTLPSVGAYLLLRLGVMVLPEGARWASSGLMTFGVVAIVYGALAAREQTDLRKRAAYWALGQQGFALVGLGSLTLVGLSACVLHLSARALVAATLLVATTSRDVAAPRNRFADLALVASMGGPGLALFWGELLAVLAAFPVAPVRASLAAIGGVLAGASHLRLLAPSTGERPVTPSAQRGALLPVAALLLVLGWWPAPLLEVAGGTLRDLVPPTHVQAPAPAAAPR